jgi:YVTN family beta-propeller protein
MRVVRFRTCLVRGIRPAFLFGVGLPVLSALALPATPAAATSGSWSVYFASFSDLTPIQGVVLPVETATDSGGTRIGLGANSSPYSIAINPDGTTAYAANSSSSSVTPIDTATNTAGTPIGVGTNPQTIAITPDGKTAYVSNNGKNGSQITPINIATNKAETPIRVSGAAGIAITPNGKTAYVVDGANAGSAGFCYVTPVNLTTRTARPPIVLDPGGANPGASCGSYDVVSPNGATVYVLWGSLVVPINTATNSAGAPIFGGTESGAALSDLAMAPNGTTLWVLDPTNSPGALFPINTATNTVGTAENVGYGGTYLAVTPDSSSAYISLVGYGGHFAAEAVNLTTGKEESPVSVSEPLELAAPNSDVVSPDQAPVAKLAATAAKAGHATSFDASASTVTYGTIASYKWKFGDGTKASTATPTTTHVYAKAGTYKASVTEISSGGTSTKVVFTGQTVSNNGGASAKAKITVSVA